jgi:predicted transcriptional regulator
VKQIALRLPDDVAAAIDELAPAGKRNGWIVQACENELGRGVVAAVPAIFRPMAAGAMTSSSTPTREHRPACKCTVCLAVYGRAGHP